jgi:hypothetical protein
MDVSRRLENVGLSREHPHIDTPFQQKISLQEEAREHLNLAKQREELLRQARAMPGFESFLLPAKYTTLFQDLPKGGIIVVVNVYKGRCDAIALRAESDKPLHIQLRNFSEEKATAYQNGWGLQLKARRLRMRGEDSVRAMGSYRQPRSTPIRRVLRGLWTDVVRPILDMLAISVRSLE